MDFISFLRCEFTNNRQGLVTGLSPAMTVEFTDCKTGGDQTGDWPTAGKFSAPAPAADFRLSDKLRAGEAVQFECASKAGAGKIIERLWDFNHGIPEVVANPRHTFDRPGKYRVTLIVWDAAGRGARAEKTIEVLPGK